MRRSEGAERVRLCMQPILALRFVCASFIRSPPQDTVQSCQTCVLKCSALSGRGPRGPIRQLNILPKLFNANE
ncbi:hypothetical protein FGO68_gene7183 [Halteria grandinella]|uniref:Uncharacterized protein n=1 Tax=Halteria grandinella TaxID=5974 RepID=A0A8J8T1F7_HALGN|nr:hypothetical protein FGO68_gene7183 [Halteria grandinella]